MNKKNTLFIISFIVLSNANFTTEPNITTEPKKEEQKQEKANETQGYIEFSSLEKDLLNALLEIKPVVTARIKNALKKINLINKELETHKIQTNKGYEYNLTEKEIIQFRDAILKPGKIFLNSIYENQNVCKDLVKKSVEDPKNSILFQFFDTPKNKIDTYFEEKINTAEELVQVGNDFTKFISDVLYNMSPNAEKAYRDFVTTITKKKQLEQTLNKK